LAELILKNPSAVVNYIFHDNLFENVDGEKLTPEEVNEAWEEYNRAKSNPHADHMLQNQMLHAPVLQANPSTDALSLTSTLSALLAQINNPPRLVSNGIPQSQSSQNCLVNGVPVDPALSKLI
uniref:Uncharacterized protein n=1 Tax=Panagrolaimus sp. ES5 TaxID=591445 RepID=A0AC34GMK2_9BILA